MLRNLTIRLKIAIIYVEIVLFTIPMVIISYITMNNLNHMAINTGQQIVTRFGVVYIIYIIVYVFVTIFIGRKLTKAIVYPLREMEKSAEKIANGDVDALPGHRSEDEVGKLAKRFSEMVEGIKVQANTLSVMAGGDYTVSIPVRSERDIMNQSINQLIDRNNQILQQISASSAQVSSGAKQMADGAQSLAQGSTEQAATVEELSSSVAEIEEKTRANAQMANRAAGLADSIMQNAEKGSRQMDELMSAVREINQASQNISKVIQVIDDIAFQTNILALNAAVEAARAGEHGKGFAVVAEEVRNLAAKSAEAAKETGSMIQNSMDKAELGAHIAGETAASLSEIVNGINESNRIIGDIARSSDEQSTGITQINTGIDQVAQVVQQNSATAEESAAASEEMSGQSSLLTELISQFKLKGDGAGQYVGQYIPQIAQAPRRSLNAGRERAYNAIQESLPGFGDNDKY